MNYRTKRDPTFLRNFVFGIEDSLVSTVGLLSGIATGQISRAILISTGLIYIFVEAFSMAVGSFLSEESAEEYSSGKGVVNGRPIFGAVVMFVSFVIAGLVPIIPYIFFPTEMQFYGSIILSIIVLFILGLVNGKLSSSKSWRRALRMAVLGGFAILVGVLVGKYVKVG